MPYYLDLTIHYIQMAQISSSTQLYNSYIMVKISNGLCSPSGHLRQIKVYLGLKSSLQV